VSSDFQLGSGQLIHAADEMALIVGIEAAIAFCLETSNVFAIFDRGGEFCQLYLDTDHDMHVETSFGGLARHAGFTAEVPEFDWLSKNFLPATWHARAKMAAGAMARAFIDTGMKFAATLTLEIHSTGKAPSDQPANPVRDTSTEGATTIGFLFNEDRPMSYFLELLAPALGLAQASSIDEIYAAIKIQIEAEYGPLNLERSDPSSADLVVELGGVASSANVFHCDSTGLHQPGTG